MKRDVSNCNCGYDIGDPRVHTHSEKCAGVYIRKLEARIMLMEAAEKHNEILQESNRVAHERIALLEAAARTAVNAAKEEISQSGYDNYSKAMDALEALLQEQGE